MEERTGRNQMVVNVQLGDFVEKEGWPNMAAYVYNRSGDFLGMGEIKQDPKETGDRQGQGENQHQA